MLSRIPGVYENGRGQFSDRPSGAGFGEAPAPQGALTRASMALSANPMVAGSSQQPEIQPAMQTPAAHSLANMAGITPGGGAATAYNPGSDSGMAARALGQISPVGMTVAQAQKAGLIGEAVGYDPAHDQRLTGGMGLAARALSQLPNQPQAAASALAQPASVQAPEVLHSGNSWSARNALRNAEVGASALRGEWDMYRDGAIDRNGRSTGKGFASPAQQKYTAMLAQDMAAQGLEPTLAAKAMSENAGLQREGLQQGGANLRTQMEQKGQAQRFLATALMQDGRDRRAAQHQAAQDSIARQRLGLDTFRATQGHIPAGYRQRADGTGMEYIPGGPADPNTIKSKSPLNDTQSKALQFGTRMQAAGQNMDQLAAGGVDQPGLIKRAADALGVGTLANWTQSPQQQQVEQSQRDFVNAVLRRESGAAISASEFDSARKQYFPQIGDSPQWPRAGQTTAA